MLFSQTILASEGLAATLCLACARRIAPCRSRGALGSQRPQRGQVGARNAESHKTVPWEELASRAGTSLTLISDSDFFLIFLF